MGSRLEGHLILPTFPLAFDLHIRLEFYEAGSHALRVLAWTSLPPTPPTQPGTRIWVQETRRPERGPGQRGGVGAERGAAD